MQQAIGILIGGAVALVVAGSASAEMVRYRAEVVTAAGDIAPAMDAFRRLFGGGNNADAPGSNTLGRREINWDGVPHDKAAPALLPGDFFSARGAMLATPGDGVQASAAPDNPAGTPPRFGNINAAYAETFTAFSAERLFSPIGSNAVDLTFVVPGSDTPAAVAGFGAVYVDVDQPETAFEYFDRDGNSLGRFPVPAMDGGFSFLGVAFDQPIVARVRIEYGTVALGPADAPDNDVAVMDDFIFGEPYAISGAAPR